MGPSYGGPYESVRHTAKALKKAGLEVRVSMPYGEEAAAHLPEWAPVPAESSGRIVFRPFEWSPDFAKSVLASDAEILHTHGIWQHPSWMALAWKRRGRLHVASIKGMLEPWAWNHNKWKKLPVWALLERRNLLSASLLHATSEQEAESIRALGINTPIAIIPHGLDLPDIPVRNHEGSSRGMRTALFLSRIHPKKGLPLLLEAWARIRPAGWRLRIVGPDEGGHTEELQKQCQKLGLKWEKERTAEGSSDGASSPGDSPAVVQFSDPQEGDAKWRAFQEADLFVLPTHSENFGMAVAEAMAMGLPVITTHGAPWKVMKEVDCGWWVPVSVDEITSALNQATSRTPDELTAMGARGSKLIAERFLWANVARDMIACYDWISGRGQKPPCVV